MIEIAPSQIYTIRDVAEYFKCSTRKIHRLVATGQLRGFKIGNQRRFKGEEILQFVERQGNDGAEPVVAPLLQADRLYSLREAAAILRLPVSEVAHLLRAGQLSGFRVGMDWRCWGRDLLRLVSTSADSEPVETAEAGEATQPSLLQLAETALGPSPRGEASENPAQTSGKPPASSRAEPHPPRLSLLTDADEPDRPIEKAA